MACVLFRRLSEMCVYGGRGVLNDVALDSTATVCWYSGEGIVYCCLVCVEVQTLIIFVWAAWHSGRMCSSLRNSLVLLAGEGGPAMAANKGTTHTGTHTLQDKNMHYVNKPLCAFQRVCVFVNLNHGMKTSILGLQIMVIPLLVNLLIIFQINQTIVWCIKCQKWFKCP